MKTILLEGPVLSESGYGYQTRFALDALLSKQDEFDVYVLPLRWGMSSWMSAGNPKSKSINELINKTNHYIKSCADAKVNPSFDIHLFVGIPNEFQRKSSYNNFIYTAGVETTKIHHEWVNRVNMTTSTILVSNFSKAVFEQTRYERKDHNGNIIPPLVITSPLKAVNYGIPNITPKPMNLELEADFNFLVVAQWGPRKNIINTLAGFFRQFKDNDNVGIVVKTSGRNNSLDDRRETQKNIKQIMKNIGNVKCKCKLIHGSVPDEEMLSLYTHPKIKALVNIGHGEGFGLPMFEAAFSGLPVITTGWSGETDFLVHNNEGFYVPVAYKLMQVQPEAVYDGVILQDSMWAYADIENYKQALKAVYENYDEVKNMANELQKILKDSHKIENKYNEFVSVLLSPYKIEDEDVEAWLKELEMT